MANGNKGYITFWVVLFFLTAGLAKSLVTAFPSGHKKDLTHSTFAKNVLTQTTEDGSGLSFLDQLRDSGADDLEFAFFGSFTIPHFLPAIASRQKFAEFSPYCNIYSVSLYDLYCNWKFHLS